MYEKVIERLLWNTAQHEYSTYSGVKEVLSALNFGSVQRKTLGDTLVIGSSEQVHVVDALAITGDEGRGSLRKATGSWQTSFDPSMSEWGNPALLGHPRLNT